MRHILLVAALAAAWLAPGFATAAKDELGARRAPFAAVQRIETELKRGSSVKDDVRKLLGEPNGSGECFLPGQDAPREVWFYEDIEVTGSRSVPDAVMVDLRQQILLVFFEGDKFDGYLFTSNVLPAIAE